MKLQMDIDPEHGTEILWALIEINRREIREAGRSGETPVLDGILDGTIVYEGEDPEEDWQTWDSVQRSRKADCEDIVAAICAECREAGLNVEPAVYRSEDGLWHVVVKLPGGRYVDPSRYAGM